jgi:hypothetical protein
MTRHVLGTPKTSNAVALAGLVAVVVWAVVHATAVWALLVSLAGVSGLVTFLVSLSLASASQRDRVLATALILIGASSALGTSGEPTTIRGAALSISGAILFCSAEFARKWPQGTSRAKKGGGDHGFSVAVVLGVATGSVCLSCGTLAIRSVLASGGPAMLVMGTGAAVLVSFLVALLARYRTQSER